MPESSLLQALMGLGMTAAFIFTIWYAKGAFGGAAGSAPDEAEGVAVFAGGRDAVDQAVHALGDAGVMAWIEADGQGAWQVMVEATQAEQVPQLLAVQQDMAQQQDAAAQQGLAPQQSMAPQQAVEG